MLGVPEKARSMTTDDPAAPNTPRRFRDDGPLPHHYPDLATGEWIACIIEPPGGREPAMRYRAASATSQSSAAAEWALLE